MARRRRSSRRSARRLRWSWLRPALPWITLFLGTILAINGAVRSLGGDVGWLSIDRLRERADALGRLAQHQLRTIVPGHEQADPREALRAAALKHGLSSRLLLAVAHVESALVPTRISGTGAMGLMQLMPGTADELGVVDPFDVADSADGGARYLKRLLQAYRGDVGRALAAYNAGPARVASSGPVRVPHETRGYVAKIRAGL